MQQKLLLAILCTAFLFSVYGQSAYSVTGEGSKTDTLVCLRAWEAESLFPMFFTGGYHLAAGYRYGHFRIRASVIYGGSYNAEKAGIPHHSNDFKRFYRPSPGIFLGYFIWKNLELYSFLEYHTYRIEQKQTGQQKDFKSLDYGPGAGYQFFVGRHLYVQPAIHLYLRGPHSLHFNDQTYTVPRADLSPVIRIGWRFGQSK